MQFRGCKLISVSGLGHSAWFSVLLINTLRFYLCVCVSVCLCVTDVGVAVTNLRVVCKIITCVPAVTEMAIIFLEIVLKSCCWSGHSVLHAGYAKDAIVDACHRTSDRQEHKIIWWAGPEQDTIFYFRVTSCREQGSHCHDERLAWVASRGQWTSFTYYNSFVSKVLGANYNRASNFHPVADKFAMH